MDVKGPVSPPPLASASFFVERPVRGATRFLASTAITGKLTMMYRLVQSASSGRVGGFGGSAEVVCVCVCVSALDCMGSPVRSVTPRRANRSRQIQAPNHAYKSRGLSSMPSGHLCLDLLQILMQFRLALHDSLHDFLDHIFPIFRHRCVQVGKLFFRARVDGGL